MLRPEGHPLLAAVIDLAMAPLDRVRPGVVGAASGRVLELGVGTGLNLPHYQQIAHLTAVEPDPHMRRRAQTRTEARPFPVELHAVSAEALPFADDSFDAVVATFVFCTIPDPAAAAREALRVLRPGGTLHFAEHVASAHAPLRAVQQLVDPAWKRVAGGCHLARDPVALLREAGAVDLVVQPRGSGWSLAPVITGTATRA